MEVLLQAIFGGLLAGMTYAILALGLVLLYRSTKVFNFAHGQCALAGAYMAAWLQGLPWLRDGAVGQIAAICLSVLCIGAFSGLLYRLVLHRLTGLDHWLAVFATFGVAAFAEAALTTVFSGRDLILTIPGLPSGGMSVLGVRLSSGSMVLSLASFVIFIGAAFFMHGTFFGRNMTAAGQNPLLSSLSGIPIHRSYTTAWSIGGALAAIAGVAFGAANVVSPAMVHLGMLAFPALLLGGMDSLLGALIGGLIIGVIQGVIAAYFDGGAVSMVVYAILLVVLLVRPQGLLGTREATRV